MRILSPRIIGYLYKARALCLTCLRKCKTACRRPKRESQGVTPRRRRRQCLSIAHAFFPPPQPLPSCASKTRAYTRIIKSRPKNSERQHLITHYFLIYLGSSPPAIHSGFPYPADTALTAIFCIRLRIAFGVTPSFFAMDLYP